MRINGDVTIIIIVDPKIKPLIKENEPVLNNG